MIVFEQLMLESVQRSGNNKLATTLFADRTARRPNSAWGWRRYADNLDAIGREQQARDARDVAGGLAH